MKAEVTYRELLALYFAQPVEERLDGAWAATYDVEETLRRMTDDAGRPVCGTDPLSGVRTLLGKLFYVEPSVAADKGIEFLWSER